MYALDFEYDNQYLSDFGFIVCDFNESSGANIVSAGSRIVFNTVSRHRGKKYGLTNTMYDECIQATFDICKDPDIYDDLEITSDEYRDLVRWLGRHEFLKFQILFDSSDYPEIEPCYYDASFNIEKVKIGEKLCGLELTMITNAPFGYGEEQVVRLDIANNSQKHTIYDMSDEIGCIYPSMTITCNADGDLTIRNETEVSILHIKNCKKGEIINIDGDTLIVISSVASHDICNDFNYEYFRIGNRYNDRENVISASLPCTLELRYFPIIKDAP